jgi:hypothetical protein
MIEKRFVERDKDGKVVGEYACLQPGYAEEELSEDHPDITAYRNQPRKKLLTPEQKLARLGITIEELKGLLNKPANKKKRK